MSQENVVAVRRLYELFNAGEIEQAVREHMHMDAEVHFPEGFPDPGPWIGHDAIVAHYQRLVEDFAEHHASVVDPEEHGEWVLVRSVLRMRGNRSGLEGELRSIAAFRFADGRVTEVRYFLDRDEALEAIEA